MAIWTHKLVHGIIAGAGTGLVVTSVVTLATCAWRHIAGSSSGPKSFKRDGRTCRNG